MKNWKNRTKKITFMLMIISMLVVAGWYTISTYYSFSESKTTIEIVEPMVDDERLFGYIFQSNFVHELDETLKLDPNSSFCKLFTNVDCDVIQNKVILDKRYQEWDYTVRFRLLNLEYQMFDSSRKLLSGNTKENIYELYLNQNLDKEYQWYLILTFDSFGNRSYVTKNNTSVAKLESQYLNSELVYQRDFQNSLETENGLGNETNYREIQLTPIKDRIFIYAIPNELKSNDAGDLITTMISTEGYYFWTHTISLLFIFIVIGLLSPLKTILKFKFIQKVLNLPAEVFLVLLCFTLGAFEIINSQLVYATINSSLNQHIDNTMLAFCFSLLWWALYYMIPLFFAWWIRYGFSIGVIKYAKENILIIRYLYKIQRFIRRIVEVDLYDHNNIKLILVVLVNAFLLMIFLNAGLFRTTVYSIIVYLIFKMLMNDIKEHYGELLNATRQMAHGNLEIEITKNLGVFNSLKEEIKQIQNGFLSAVQEEIKSQKMKTELVSNVSHDLKTPLTSIISYIDLLKNSNLSIEQRAEYIQILDRNSMRLKHLIEDLFEVSKANSGDISLNLIEVDINALLIQTQFELQDQIEKSNLIFKNQFCQEKIVLTLDSQKTYRIFENLYVNALKYALKNSRVYVSTNIIDDVVEISFKNTAAIEIDFDPNDIVERFARGDQSRNSDGSGLGLAIAKSFTEFQNGTFDIFTDGDIFKVILRFYQ